MHPAMVYLIKALLALSALLGVMVCFFGYRLFKVILALFGFFTCGMVAASAGHAISSGNDFVGLIAGLVGGVVGAVLFVMLYYIGVFLMGACFVVFLLTTCAEPVHAHPVPLVVLILAIMGGLLALVVQKFVIIVATSFTGAWQIVLSALHLLHHGPPERLHYHLRALDRAEVLLLVAWILLGTAGALVQYLVTARHAPSPAPPPTAPRVATRK